MCYCLACSYPPWLSLCSLFPKHFKFSQPLSCIKALTGRKYVCHAVSKLFLERLLDKSGFAPTGTLISFYLEKKKIHSVYIKNSVIKCYNKYGIAWNCQVSNQPEWLNIMMANTQGGCFPCSMAYFQARGHYSQISECNQKRMREGGLLEEGRVVL